MSVSCMSQAMYGGKKSVDPIVINGDTIRVGDQIRLAEGSSQDASFNYVRFKTGNAPVQSAYAYTNFEVMYFMKYKHADHPFIVAKQNYYKVVINSLPAIQSKEIQTPEG